jgi:hypothetical protein
MKETNYGVYSLFLLVNKKVPAMFRYKIKPSILGQITSFYCQIMSNNTHLRHLRPLPFLSPNRFCWLSDRMVMGSVAGTMIWDASDANPMHRRLPAEVDGWDDPKIIQVTGRF